MIFIGFSLGLGWAKEFEDESIIWTPAGNPSLEAKDKSKILFPTEEKFRSISLIIENDDNVITKETLEQLLMFEEILYSTTELDDTTLNSVNQIERPGKGSEFTWKDICMQRQHSRINNQGNPETINECDGFSMLDFVYSKNTDFADGDSKYGYGTMPSDSNLLARLRTGKGNEDNFGTFDYILL